MAASPRSRDLLVECLHAAVAAADPAAAVERHLRHHPLPAVPVVLGLGKAAPAMARGVARALGGCALAGLVVGDHIEDVPAGIDLMVGGHPVPDRRSIAAGRALLDRAASLDDGDLALVLVSGGGSALAEAPLPGVSLGDIAATTERLLRSGAAIDEINTARSRLSLLKGGGLARAIAPARVITLVLSDVVGDRLEVIASGPTVESGEEDDPTVAIVGNAATAAAGAAEAARRLGKQAIVVDTTLTGEASRRAGDVIEHCRHAEGDLFVFAGETTVTVTGKGRGGRNQEAALAAAVHLDGTGDITFLAAGTDGIDGTTDAAGAVVDGDTVRRGTARGMNAVASLAGHDSGGYFAGSPERIVTGPTGTNVGDLWLVLRR